MAWHREVAYRRLDEHGEERCVYACMSEMCIVEGMGAAAIDGSGMVFEYRLELSEDWRIRHAAIVIRLGQDESRRIIERRDDAIWVVDGVHAVEFDGFEDLDLAFTPTTNTVAIRRLALDVGESGTSRSLLITDPELDVHGMEQHYSRVDDRRYLYQAREFSAEIEVDDDGVLIAYPGLFELAQPLMQGAAGQV